MSSNGQITGALILGNEYQALGLLRQLTQIGLDAVLVDQDRWGIARFSRCPKRFFQSPPYDSDEFWPWLKNKAQEEGFTGAMVIPTDDEQVRQLAVHYDEVQELFRYAGPDWRTYSVLYDKRETCGFAGKHDIPIPRTFLPTSENRYPDEGLQYPFIVKPAVKCRFKKVSKKKAYAVASERELKELLEGELAGVPIEDLHYQEIIPGGGTSQWSYAGFWVNGKPAAAYTARRNRQHPPDYGRASTHVIAEYDEEVERESRRVMEALSYTGFGEVEWKRHAETGKLYFLEVNARSWGWHSLSSLVVGNLPEMAHEYLVSGSCTGRVPRYGARWVKWITDIPVAFHLMGRKELSFGAYLESIRGNTMSCEWESGDPLPFFLQFLLVPYLMIKRGY